MPTNFTPADVLAHGHAVFAYHIKLALAATKVNLAASLAIDVIAAEAMRAGGALHALTTLAPEVTRELNDAHGQAAAQMRAMRESLIDGIKPTPGEMAEIRQAHDDAADFEPMWISQGGKPRAVSHPATVQQWRVVGALALGGEKTASAAAEQVYRTPHVTSPESEQRQAEVLIQVAVQELADQIHRFGLHEDVLQALKTRAPTSGSAVPVLAPEQASPQSA